MSQMHDEDAHDDNLITMEISDHIHTRAQMRAAENAANSHILDTNDLNQDTNSSLHMRDDNLVAPTIHEIAPLLPTTLPRAPPLLILLPSPPPLLNMMRLALTYMRILLITLNSRLQKHLHVILLR